MAARGRPQAPDHIVNPNLVLDRDELVENLENITHRSLVEETQTDIIVVTRHGLIHNSFNCPNCNSLCRLNSWNETNAGKIWRCRGQNCNFTKSIRADSFFDNSHLSLTEIVDFIYFWSKKLSLSYIMEETGIEEWHIAVDWANFIRDICGFWYVLNFHNNYEIKIIIIDFISGAQINTR